MLDIYQTISELNILFQCMILDILGHTKTGSPPDYDPSVFQYVRISWPTLGAPAWKISEDIVFLQITEEDEQINRQREVEVTKIDEYTLNEAVTYTRVIALSLVFYGPNSFESAQKVRDGVFNDQYRLPIAKNDIYLIPDIVAPVRAPEIFAGRYWERVDLNFRFNELILKNRAINVIKTAEIILQNDEGEIEKTICE